MNTHNRQLDSVWRQRAMRLLLATSFCLVFAAITQAQAQTIVVPGTSGRVWVNAGLAVPPGTLLRLVATGEVDLGAGRVSGPGGTPKFDESAGFPAATRYRYGLVARLTTRLENPGVSGDDLFEQWGYGEFPSKGYCAARGGHLWLTVNDDSPGDNHGAFTVVLTRGTCRSEAEQTRLRVNLYMRPMIVSLDPEHNSDLATLSF
jgi:hypothetical protein